MSGDRPPAWRRYLRFWRPDVEADVDDEIRFHLETRIEELVERGLATDAARAQALAEFGDPAAVRDGLREIDRRLLDRRRRDAWWAALGRDVRFALRRLRLQPGFSVPAAVTIGLGVGAVAAVFALVHAVLLRPLPYPAAGRLVAVHHVAPGLGLVEGGLSDGTYAHYRARNRAFEEMGSWFDRVLSVTEGAEPERILTALVTPSVFEVLRARPALGRACRSGGDGETIEVVLAHAFWERRYGGDPRVLGRTIELNRSPRVVVGVMRPDFAFPHHETQLWFCMPVDSSSAQLRSMHQRGIARLREGVSLEGARADLQSLVPALADVYADVTPELLREARVRAVVEPLRDAVLRDVRPALVLLLCTAGLVLLIAGANVGNLFLARSEHRRREVAIARALGASSRDLARRFLVESLVLAAIGGALGLVLAHVGVTTRFGFEAGQIPRLHELRLGGAVVGVTAVLTVLVGALLGGLALARAHGADPARVLRATGGRTTPSRPWRRAQRALVVVQVTFALALLVASAAMVASVRKMRDVPLGFDPADLLAFEVALPFQGYASYHDGAHFFHELARRLRAVPGVVAAEAAGELPLAPSPFGDEPVRADDGTTVVDATPPLASGRLVTPGFFRAMRIPLRHGRGFRAGDLLREDGAVVVSAALARALWGREDVAGRRLRLVKRPDEAPLTVVGVVGDVPGARLADGPSRMLYFPVLEDLARHPDVAPRTPYYPRELTLVVRTTLGPAELLAAARRAVDELDPKVPIARLRTMEQVVAAAGARTRLTALLLLIASGASLVLGAVGVYGVVSYGVSLRTGEFGVRLALGASPAALQRMVLREEAIVVAAGLVAGGAVALGVVRLLRGLLYGVNPTDPALFAAMAGLLAIVGLAAGWIPARRAGRVDPAVALRAE